MQLITNADKNILSFKFDFTKETDISLGTLDLNNIYWILTNIGYYIREEVELDIK